MGCSCGFILKQGNVELKERVKVKNDSIDIVDSNDEMSPQTEAECSKCGFGKAYFWLVQTRAGDEPETKFLKCVKCSHTWRDYS